MTTFERAWTAIDPVLELGLSLSPRTSPKTIVQTRGRPRVVVESVRLARPANHAGGTLDYLVIEVLQERHGYLDRDAQRKADSGVRRRGERADFTFRGGCTLIVDPLERRIKYAITKHILSERRLEQQREFLGGGGLSGALEPDDPTLEAVLSEPFRLVHAGYESRGAP